MNFDYKFTFSDGSEKHFKVKLDQETLAFIRPGNNPSPDWTKLDYCKCANCSLDEKEHTFCPIAVNLVDLIDFFKNDKEYGGCTVILGVPTYWRTLVNDSVTDPKLHEVILKADIVSPWMVGRFVNPEKFDKFAPLVVCLIAMLTTSRAVIKKSAR